MGGDENMRNHQPIKKQKKLNFVYKSKGNPKLRSRSRKVKDIAARKQYLNISNSDDSTCSNTSHNDTTVPSTQEKLCLKHWGLPEPVLKAYESKKILQMFPWQLECLTVGNVLKGKNLVYSAPTSAGKTLVAEILMIKTVLERRLKAIVILPFVSVVCEKMVYFQDLLENSGVRVEGLMGGRCLVGGFSSVDVAICTIEKANGLINRLLEDHSLGDVGCVVVDELHLLGDPFRGYLLELLLTKIKYMCIVKPHVKIQVIGMSATLPNLQLLADWLDADLYQTDFRPVPLDEYMKVGPVVYNKEIKRVYDLKPHIAVRNDPDHIIYLCLQSILSAHSVLIFCPTKAWCEKLAQNIAQEIYNIGSSNSDTALKLQEQLSCERITEAIQQLKRCPSGLDKSLYRTVSFGVAFHHAGLTLDERDIIEGCFHNGTLRVLVATSTLSSGVNLPARRVIVRSPVFHGKPLDFQTYKQMIGRAGRMGKDTAGESFLICQPSEQRVAETLMKSSLQPVVSCLGHGDLSASLKRAILEVVASGVARTPDEVKCYGGSTLLALTQTELQNPLTTCLKFLQDKELIRLQKDEESLSYISTPLGNACLAASLSPDQGLELFQELQKARQCFVLENDLHIIYLVTPYSVSSQMGNLDWLQVLGLWENLPVSMRRVGELVGVEERFMVRAMRGTINVEDSSQVRKLSVHRRFYTALALQDLVNEVPLQDVAAKFNCSRGMLQSLQQSAATFAGMVTAFCNRLGWSSFELLVSQFQDRLHFGVQRELCDLMRLSALNGPRARALFNAGLTSVASIASSDVNTVEDALFCAIPFQTTKELDGETSFDKSQRNKMRNVWVTGRQGLTEREAAALLIKEARIILRRELGLVDAKWESVKDMNSSQISQNDEVSTSSSFKKEEQVTSPCKENQSSVSSHMNEDLEKCYNDDTVPDSSSLKESSTDFASQLKGDQSLVLNTSVKEENSPVCSQFHNKTLNDCFNDEFPDDDFDDNIHKISPDDTKLQFLPEISCINESLLEPHIEKEEIKITECTAKLEIGEEKLNDSGIKCDTNSSSVKYDLNTSDFFLSSLNISDSKLFGDFVKDNKMNSKLCGDFVEDNKMNSKLCGDFVEDNEMNSKLCGDFVEDNEMNSKLCGDFVEDKEMNSKLCVDFVEDNEMNSKLCSDFVEDNEMNENHQHADDSLTEDKEKNKSPCEKSLNSTSQSTDMFSSPETKDSSLFTDSFLVDTQLGNMLDDPSPKPSLNVTHDKIQVLSHEITSHTGSVSSENRNNQVPGVKSNSRVNESYVKTTRTTHCVSVKKLDYCNPVVKLDTKFSESCLKTSTISSTSERKIGNGVSLVKSDSKVKENVLSTIDFNIQNLKSTTVVHKAKKSIENYRYSEELIISTPSKLIDITQEAKSVTKRNITNNNLSNILESSTEDVILKQNFVTSEKFSCKESKTNSLVVDRFKTETKTFGNNLISTEEAYKADKCSELDDCDIFEESFTSLEIAHDLIGDKSNDFEENIDEIVGDSEDEETSRPGSVLATSCNEDKTGTPKKLKLSASFKLSSPLRKPESPSRHKNESGQNLDSSETSVNAPLKRYVESRLYNGVDIIDVCEHRTFYKRLMSELKHVSHVSLSLACEKLPESEPSLSIGDKIIGKKRKRQSGEDGYEFLYKELAVVGVAVYTGKQYVYYIGFSNDSGSVVSTEEKLTLLRAQICECDRLKALQIFDVKEQSKIFLSTFGITLTTKCVQDPEVADWLLDTDSKRKSLHAMYMKYCPTAVPDIASKTKSFRSYGSIGLQTHSNVSACLRACIEAYVSWNTLKEQQIRLSERNLWTFYCDVEMPTVLCVARLELFGIGFCRSEVEQARGSLQKQMRLLEKSAYELAGHTFSLSSPSDVAKVLYNELQLKPRIQGNGKKRSTNKDTLAQLENDHPLPSIIIKWRKIHSIMVKLSLDNLTNKYGAKKVSRSLKVSGLSKVIKTIYPLLNIGSTDRIFGRCIMHTSTGRISMYEPNLQNIPRDFDICSSSGSETCISVRRAFISGKGKTFVSADYCQLELRILGFLSGESSLCAYHNEDMFTNMAASFLNIPAHKVCEKERQQAKHICYGMLYGMGTKALAEHLDVSESEAMEFASSFYTTYPGVKKYFEDVVSKCQRTGYVETVCGRRRYLPGINSTKSVNRSHARRQAINSTIQGSAADIVKHAMVEIEKKLQSRFPLRNLKPTVRNNQQGDHVACLVLHLHDELLYEVDDNHVSEVAKIIKDTMEKPMSSFVLPVRVKAGKSWGCLKECTL